MRLQCPFNNKNYTAPPIQSEPLRGLRQRKQRPGRSCGKGPLGFEVAPRRTAKLAPKHTLTFRGLTPRSCGVFHTPAPKGWRLSPWDNLCARPKRGEILTFCEAREWTSWGRMSSFTTASARSSLWSARRPRARAAVCWTLGTTSNIRGRSRDKTPEERRGEERRGEERNKH